MDCTKVEKNKFVASERLDTKWQNQLPSSDFNTFKGDVNSISGPY